MSYTEILNSDISTKDKGYNLTSGGSNIVYNANNRHYTETEKTRRKRSESAKKKWQDPEYRKRYKNSRKEYIKVVKLSIDGDLLEIYPTITDAEKYLYGKKNGSLWYPLKRYNKEIVELGGYKWMLLESYNKKSQESRK